MPEKEKLTIVFCTKVGKEVLAKGKDEFEVNAEVHCATPLGSSDCKFWLANCSKRLVIVSSPLPAATPNGDYPAVEKFEVFDNSPNGPDREPLMPTDMI